MAQPLVSVVIPNWNGIAYLPDCLESVRNQIYPRVEICVVDNASTDGSQEMIRKRFPTVNILQLHKNCGFAGASNAGMRLSRGDIICLLNNDTEAAPEWIAEVVAAFGRHPEAGLIASKMLLFDRRDTLHTAGDFVRINGLPGNRGVWQRDDQHYNQEEYVFSACGGSAAYRRSMLDQIGLLDDDFFFSCEDVDLSWRAQLAGWKCVYAPKAIVYHRLAATGGGPIASFYDGRNFLWLIAKDYPGPLLRKYWRDVVEAQVRLAWQALLAWRGTAARARLRGMTAGVLFLVRMLRKRQVIQAGRKVPLEYIDSILTPISSSDGYGQ